MALLLVTLPPKKPLAIASEAAAAAAKEPLPPKEFHLPAAATGKADPPLQKLAAAPKVMALPWGILTAA